MMEVSHDPEATRHALEIAVTAYIDLETTGIERHDQIVSAGILINNNIYILFLRSVHRAVRNLPLDRFRRALEPLARGNLVTVYHNAPFDTGHLYRAGFGVAGTVHDTLQMLRLVDQDRGGDGTDVFRRRRDLRAPAGAPQFTDYKLKHVVPMLVGLRMIDYPGDMAALPYREHVRYLASDLVGTKALYEHLTARLDSNPGLRAYYDRLCAPLTPLLVSMTEHGIAADTAHIHAEIGRLDSVRRTLEAHHVAAYGAAIDTNAATARWLWGALRLRPLPGNKVRQGGRWVPSLKAAHLKELAALHRGNPVVAGSLAVISAHRRALDLQAKLGGLAKAVGSDGRIHSSLVDRQATGRVTSSGPNLQALARETWVGDALPSFRLRNALVASPDCVLVAFDLAQADIRVIAHAVATFPYAHQDHVADLRRRRYYALCRADPRFGALYALLPRLRNPQYQPVKPERKPEFDPKLGSGLAVAFQDSTADFYTVAATTMLGAPPRDSKERNFCKQTILGIVNGMGPTALAKRLRCDVTTAKEYQARFEAAYPNELAFRRLMVAQITLTGAVTDFAGRARTDTAQHWLVSRPRVKIFITYKRSDRYWLDVTPLAPKARVLTCYVHRAWDARPGAYEGALIYDAASRTPQVDLWCSGSTSGCTTSRPYRLYDTTFLEYRLPVRNIAWRSIRKVRVPGEEAQYRGLDSVTRALFNALAQSGTASISKLTMLGAVALCERYHARLLLQIHDELVFEVPTDRRSEFVEAAVPLLQGLVPGFTVPIILEPKFGFRFGALEWRGVKAILSRRPIRHPPRPSRSTARVLVAVV